jgi:hypothetical protein
LLELSDVETFTSQVHDAGGFDWVALSTETRMCNGQNECHLSPHYGLESEKFISPPPIKILSKNPSKAFNDTLKTLFFDACKRINTTMGTDECKRHYVVASRLIITKFLLIRDIAIETSKHGPNKICERFGDIDAESDDMECHLGKLVRPFFQ